MTIVKVFTNDGQEVAHFIVPEDYGNATWRNMLGRNEEPLGWLGRTLSDARIIAAGGDPERPSEKVMRLMAERKQRKT